MKAAVPVLLVAFGLAGCGAEAQPSALDTFQGAEREVAQKVEDLEAAGKGRDPEDICGSILAARVVDELEEAGTDCVDEMEKAIDDADDFDLETRDVTITGTTATARVQRGEDGPTETMRFTREDGEWRATSLSG